MEDVDKKEVEKDLNNYSALEAVKLSEGGQIIINSFIKDILSSIDTLSIKYSKLTLQEFISISADIKSKLDIVKMLTRSTKNKEDAKTINDLLTNAITE